MEQLFLYHFLTLTKKGEEKNTEFQAFFEKINVKGAFTEKNNL